MGLEDREAKLAIAEALEWLGPKKNQYYNADRAKRLKGEFETELQYLEQADENLYRTNISFDGEDYPYYNPGGSMWDCQHPVMAGGSSYDW